MMRQITYILILLTGVSIVGCSHQFDGIEENTPTGNFESLWRTIDQKYCFIDEKNVDWQIVHDTILPKIKTLNPKDYLQLFDLLAGMLNTLQDGHVNLYAPFDVSQCPGWYEGYPQNFNWQIIKEHYLDTARHVGYTYYQTIADGEIGYVYYSSFETPITSGTMAYILRSFIHCKGIIIDVRNNGGGSLEYAKLLASTFFRESRTVALWQHKTGPRHNEFSKLEPIQISTNQMPNKWFRPVVVLCNRHTYSAANFFVNAMRYADNCLIIGGTSGGGGGMPLSYDLPNGWIVRFSSIRMTDKDTISIENGITPDISITQESDYQDDLIEKACDVILASYKN